MQKKNVLDYFSFGMPMPNRINGANSYRYGYQGEFAETDPETGKPAFQLRLYDTRLGRWLSPDPMGQYHSPYMAMDNTPQQSIDPTGGCTVGDDCPPEFDWMDAGTWVADEINLSGGSEVNWGSASISGGGLIDFSTASESTWDNIFSNPFTVNSSSISPKINSWRENWKESDNGLASISYSVIDAPYTFFANFSLISDYPHDLSGKPFVRGSSKHLDASVDGLISLAPFMRVRMPKLNGGQFIGTVNKIPVVGKEIIKRSGLRGKLNLAYNWFLSKIGSGVLPNAGTINTGTKKAHDIIHN